MVFSVAQTRIRQFQRSAALITTVLAGGLPLAVLFLSSDAMVRWLGVGAAITGGFVVFLAAHRLIAAYFAKIHVRIEDNLLFNSTRAGISIAAINRITLLENKTDANGKTVEISIATDRDQWHWCGFAQMDALWTVLCEAVSPGIPINTERAPQLQESFLVPGTLKIAFTLLEYWLVVALLIHFFEQSHLFLLMLLFMISIGSIIEIAKEYKAWKRRTVSTSRFLVFVAFQSPCMFIFAFWLVCCVLFI